MKKIIEGKAYNTETAQKLGGHRYGYPGDFDYVSEDLYRTRKGAYFVHGEGGPRSKYGRSSDDNTISGGEGIRPVTEAEARAFMEKHASAEDYETAFGEVEEA